MRKEILSEIDRMKFLVGYSKGRVISEQENILSEQKIEDGKPNFRALVSDLKNDFYPEWYYIPEKSNITSLTGDPKSFVAVRSNNQFKRVTRGTLYLRANGDVFKDKEGTESVIGKWYYKSTPTAERKFELKVDINKPDKTDDKSSNSSDVKTDPATTTQTDPATTTKTKIEKMEFPIKVPLEKITFEKNDTDSIVSGYPDLDVISPIDGVLASSSSNRLLFINSNDNNFKLFIYGVTNSLKAGDKVSKGQNLGKSEDYFSVELSSRESYKNLNLKDYFKF